MFAKRGFSLIELLVVIAVISVLAAILFPIYGHVREKGRQATCINNQRQIALTAIMFAQDHDGMFPAQQTFWSELNLDPKLLRCLSRSNKVVNAYVCNNVVPASAIGSYETPQQVMLTADGEHSATLDTFDGMAYAPRDLLKVHHGKYIMSYLDGHVALTDEVPVLVNVPQPGDMTFWFSSDFGTKYNGLTKGMSIWTDMSNNRFNALPIDPAQPPIYYESVASLGGNPALHFQPPVSHPSLLLTDDISSFWEGNEATMFIVFHPEGNNENYEFSVFDQENGADPQGTRVKTVGSGSPAPALTGSLNRGVAFAGNGNPSLSFTPSAPSIVRGGSVTISWSCNGNTQAVTGSTNFAPAVGSTELTGSRLVAPNNTTTYSISIVNGNGSKTATVSVTVTVTDPVPTVTLSANPTSIVSGGSTTLSWHSTNATSASGINFTPGSVADGTITVSPTVTTTYTITVTGSGGTASATQTVTVTAASISVNLSASPTTIEQGQSTTLTWTSTGANHVDNNGTNFTASGVNGITTVSPSATTTYTIKVKTGNNSASDSVTITVIPQPPTLTLTADPMVIQKGDSTSLTWNATNATALVSSNFGATSVSGSKSNLKPTVTTTYTITVSGSGGETTKSVTVTVGDLSYTGKVSWFRKTATVNYPPVVPYNTPTLWTVVSSSTAYTIYDKGISFGAYPGGPDWQKPTRFTIGGSQHGSNANQRSFDGYVAEIIIYRKVLTDEERQRIEKYLMRKYKL